MEAIGQVGWKSPYLLTRIGAAKRLTTAADPTIDAMKIDAMEPDSISLTQKLCEHGDGDPEAANELFALLYDELKRVAFARLRREGPGHTLSATALAHEAWFALAAQTRTRWKNRGHFLAVASTMMRRILVSHARGKQADKRDAVMVTLSNAHEIADGAADPELLRVHEALLAFEAVDPRAAKVVELRFFGGLELDEIADALHISLATAKRDWSVARAWLRRELASS